MTTEQARPATAEHPVFGAVIHAYTRAQALEDGVLVGASAELHAQTGFQYPVAYTAAVYSDVIEWGAADGERTGEGQNQDGRERDVLMMLNFAIRAGQGRPPTDTLHYHLSRVNRFTGQSETVRLKAVVGPGDRREPVMTVMLPEEG